MADKTGESSPAATDTDPDASPPPSSVAEGRDSDTAPEDKPPEDDAVSTSTDAGSKSEGSEKPIAATSDAGASTKTAPKTDHDDKGKRKRDKDASKGSEAERKSLLAGTGKAVKAGSDLIRNRIASVVWLVAVLAAVVLAMGALLIALDANQTNGLVEAVLNLANKIDGPFWRIFDFYRENKQGARLGPDSVKNHLVNWGLAAVAYLIGGRILDRVIRP